MRNIKFVLAQASTLQELEQQRRVLISPLRRRIGRPSAPLGRESMDQLDPARAEVLALEDRHPLQIGNLHGRIAE
jgi:hypothetical protein